MRNNIKALFDDKADQAEGTGRDLMEVLLGHPISDMTTQELRNEAIAEVMFNFRRRYNNNGEIDSSGIPDFRGLMTGDYLDGLDLSGVTAAPGGTAPQAWNNAYKNNRIVLSGFNTFKGSGDTETTKNHILFTFRNIVCQGYMNPTNTNAGGYRDSALREWLEGADGDGTGAFAQKLMQALGGNYLLTVRQLLSHKSDWGQLNTTVFPPSEHNIFGNNAWSQANIADGYRVQFPIFQKSTNYRVKRYNGARGIWRASSLADANSTDFAIVNLTGSSHNGGTAGAAFGISPAFCAV
jgi:hypothetical protein